MIARLEKVLAEEKKAKKEKAILPADQPWLNVHDAAKIEKRDQKQLVGKDDRVKKKNGGFIAKGCGKVMNNRRKVTTMS